MPFIEFYNQLDANTVKAIYIKSIIIMSAENRKN